MLSSLTSRRWAVFLTGITTSGLGVAMTTRAGLGTTPISSVPYVLSLCTPLTIGTWTLLMNLVFLAVQALMLRRNFPPVQLLQIPATFLFGMVIDLGMWLFRPFISETYPLQLLMLATGSLILAFGIALQVLSDLLCLPGDALVKLTAGRHHLPLGRLKVCFDCTLTVLAIVISLAASSSLRGIREGTIAGALLVGAMVGMLMPPLGFIRRLCGNAGTKRP